MFVSYLNVNKFISLQLCDVEVLHIHDGPVDAGAYLFRQNHSLARRLTNGLIKHISVTEFVVGRQLAWIQQHSKCHNAHSILGSGYNPLSVITFFGLWVILIIGLSISILYFISFETGVLHLIKRVWLNWLNVFHRHRTNIVLLY